MPAVFFCPAGLYLTNAGELLEVAAYVHAEGAVLRADFWSFPDRL
jgi:hypothetical protein